MEREAPAEERAVAEYQRWLIGHLAQLLKIDPAAIDLNSPLEDLGVDSVTLTGLAQEIEDYLGVPVSTETVLQHRQIRSLAQAMAGLNGCVPPSNSEAAIEPVAKTPEQPTSRPVETNGHALSSEGPSSMPGLSRDEQVEVYAERSLWFQTYRNDGHYYFQTEIDSHDGSWVQAEGRRMLMLASYSYLGLMGHPEIEAACTEAISQFGSGVHGVRALAGTNRLHVQLEREIAEFFRAESAIVLSSGFLTNLSIIATLVHKDDLVLGDEFNHASLVDGCVHSQAQFEKFAHNDLDDLERRLRDGRGRKRLVVVDAVYSMEGDIPPLPQIVALCRKYHALLMVDEAHSFGVLGATGRGVQEHFDLPPDAIDIKMGTLSKAIPSGGGFVAGRSVIIEYLKHHSRGYIFSGAPTAPQIAAARKGLELLIREPERVTRLRHNSARFLAGIKELGYRTTDTQTAIIPLLFPTVNETLRATGLCRKQGLFVVPVVYPAVPLNAPRIRTTVLASHTDEEIDFALAGLKAVKGDCL